MSTTHLTVDTPSPFSFAETAYSHGWIVLQPNAWDADLSVMTRIHRLSSGRVVRLVLRQASGGPSDGISVRVDHGAPLPRGSEEEIRSAVTRMFRLDEDLSEFYAMCREEGGRWKRVTQGLGRLLRSPTLFEDVVKTICTTNIQWGGTRRMVRELVQACGEALPEEIRSSAEGDELPGPGDGAPDVRDEPGGGRAFPTARSIAARSLESFSRQVNLGYRAPYVYELAERVATGELDLEALADADIPTPALEKQLLDIKGVGSYAASTLLMLLGRYDQLAVDSVFRQFVSQRYFDGDPADDAEARAVYEEWGEWKFLAYWYDLWAGLEEEL